MTFHMCAYEEAIDNTANTDLDAITDDVLTISNSHFLLQQDMDIIGAAAMSANLTRGRIVSPSNRQITLPFIRPIIGAAVPGDNPNYANYLDNPFRVRGLEELAIETSGVCMGTEQSLSLLALQTTMEPVPRGNIFTMRGTSTTTTTALTWTTLTTTWADILPEGTYLVCGLEVQAATCVAARIIFEGQVWRPGSLGITGLTQRNPAVFRKGGLGVWGRFTSTAMPQIQQLNTAGVSSHEIYMDIMRIG